METKTINSIKDLSEKTVLLNDKNEEVTVLSITGSLVWTSYPNQPDVGWRCWTLEDLSNAGINSIKL